MTDGTVLVTGANGFVGAALVEGLARRGRPVVGAVRSPSSAALLRRAPSLESGGDWRPLLSGCDTVVHAAARVHVMQESAADPLAEFRKVNVAGTLALARQAAEAGVRRFVFVSSIKVNGEETRPGHPFTAADAPAPVDAYGQSKLEAEIALRELAADSGLELVVIRPPLVYGPGVRANFESMMRWVARGVPLPLGAIRDNRRSLVALDNLVDLIATAIEHPAAAGTVLLAADGEDLSTAELLERVGRALGKRPRLIPVPPALLRLGAAALGKGALARRLLGSLQVDTSATRRLLGWAPPVGVDQALALTARHFLEREGR